MLEPDGSPNTAHSMNPVPLIVTADVGDLREGGILADVAPTVLALLGEEQPGRDDRQAAARGLTARLTVPAFEIDARDGSARAGVIQHRARRRCGRRRSCRSPRPRPSSRSTPAEVAELGYDMVLGNTFHLFIQPGHELIAELGGLHEFMGWERPIITDSGGYQVFSMGHGSVAEEIKRRRDERAVDGHLDRGGGRALPLVRRRRASASWAPRPRWRSRPRSARTSRWRSTSARPSTSSATTPRRSMERTHRWLDRCVAWRGEHAPAGPAAVRDRAGRGVRGPARRVGGLRGRRGRGRHRDRRLARAGRRSRCARSSAGRSRGLPDERAAAPARHRRRGRHRPRGGRRASTPSTAPRPRAWRATAPRSSHDPARRWRLDLTKGAHRTSREPIDAGLPVPGLPRAHARLPALPGAARRADRASACSRSTT